MKRIKQNKKDKREDILKFFFIGIILAVVVQSIFMVGGLFIERSINVPITGIPSAIGLTAILIIGLLLVKKSEYILLGSFAIIFLAPLILFLIVLFNAMEFLVPYVYYSIIYLTALILIVWIYYIHKILRGRL